MAFLSPALTDTTVLPRDHAPARRGFFSVLLAAMIESRQHAADREIARYIARNGGKLTDSVEFEIEQGIYAKSRGL